MCVLRNVLPVWVVIYFLTITLLVLIVLLLTLTLTPYWSYISVFHGLWKVLKSKKKVFVFFFVFFKKKILKYEVIDVSDDMMSSRLLGLGAEEFTLTSCTYCNFTFSRPAWASSVLPSCSVLKWWVMVLWRLYSLAK